ncbi:hypothetical protein EE612_026872, partial [Oryza sativa]
MQERGGEVGVGGGGERGGRLGGDVGAGAGGVHHVRRAGRVHVLGALPARVVGVAVADLHVQRLAAAGRRVRPGEVVGAPPHGVERVAQLARRVEPVAVLHDAPRQRHHRERHGEPELDVVAGVVVAAGQVRGGRHRRRGRSRRATGRAGREGGGRSAGPRSRAATWRARRGSRGHGRR